MRQGGEGKIWDYPKAACEYIQYKYTTETAHMNITVSQSKWRSSRVKLVGKTCKRF